MSETEACPISAVSNTWINYEQIYSWRPPKKEGRASLSMKGKISLRTIRWLTFFWAALIAWLSTSGGVQLPPTWLDAIGPDKVGHFLFYGILAYLTLHVGNGALPRKSSVQWAWVMLTIIYGIAFEVIQYTFFPNRYFEVFDIMANTAGSISGWLMAKKRPL